MPRYEKGVYEVCPQHEYWDSNLNALCPRCYEGQVQLARANYRDELVKILIPLLMKEPFCRAFLRTAHFSKLMPSGIDAKAMADTAYEMADALMERKFIFGDKPDGQ